jgi:hypothetical protein
MWFVFNLHRKEFFFLYQTTHIIVLRKICSFIWKEKDPYLDGSSLYEVANPHLCWSLAQSQLSYLRPLTCPGTCPLPPSSLKYIHKYLQTTLIHPNLLFVGRNDNYNNYIQTKLK